MLLYCFCQPNWIYVFIYILGCVACYGKLLAINYEIDEWYPTLSPDGYKFARVFWFGSWPLFVGLTLVSYIMGYNKYFFKWTYRPLRGAYKSRNIV